MQAYRVRYAAPHKFCSELLVYFPEYSEQIQYCLTRYHELKQQVFLFFQSLNHAEAVVKCYNHFIKTSFKF